MMNSTMPKRQYVWGNRVPFKPISSGKLLEALNGVSESIRREKEDKDLVRKYMEEMRENTEHEKQKFFEQMIAGNLSMADALETGKNMK